MAKRETTERSDLDADHLPGRLRDRAVARLADQDEVWAIVDPSELRKPYAKEMPDLMRVRALSGEGTVRGYRTLNVLGVGTGGRRGILYHHLFSSAADDFVSESRETQDALTTVGQALSAHQGNVTYVMDKQFDDIAVWATILDQGNHLVCRLQHPNRQSVPARSRFPTRLAYARSTQNRARPNGSGWSKCTSTTSPRSPGCCSPTGP